MSVPKRELKNDNETSELFKRPLVFHNTKTDGVILLYGVLPNKNLLGHRLSYHDSHLINTNVCEFFPAAFWKIVGLDEVVEIDILDLPYWKVQNAQNN